METIIKSWIATIERKREKVRIEQDFETMKYYDGLLVAYHNVLKLMNDK